jgi:hypothetical protein
VTRRSSRAYVKPSTKSTLDEDERAQLLARITAIQRAPDTPSSLARYTDFIALAANYMTIVGPFLPPLAALLSGK